ncbi:MAG TPA: diacylglycerol kinase family protein [Chloroflexota bacterium]|nr:diacylglycerol kinase family protein [Chloroflexota bacterium]
MDQRQFVDDRPRRALIIHNPVSGRVRSHRLVSEVASRLRGRGWTIEVAQTRRGGDATALALEAVRDQYPLVVAAGGDGTINEVLQPLVETGVTLGVLPVGTVNLWAAETGIPAHPASLAALLDRRSERWVDVGQIGSRYFLLMASVGFDAAVVAAVSGRLKQRFGRFSYAVAASNLAPGYRGTWIRLRLDGRETRMSVLVLLIGNTRRYAGSWQPIRHAVADDGALDVLAIRGTRVWSGIPQVGALFRPSANQWPALFWGRAREIEIESESPIPVQMDGDAAGSAPARVIAVPRALRVVVGDYGGSLFGAKSE